MTEHDSAPAAGESSTVPSHNPYYCVHDPETDEWLIVLKHLPDYLREAIFEKTEGPDITEDWHELRQPNWAIHMLHLQAEEGSEEAKQMLADSTATLRMPQGWNEWVEENFRHGEPAMAPNYHPEYSLEQPSSVEPEPRRDLSGPHMM